LELASGTLGGIVTTVEGLITRICESKYLFYQSHKLSSRQHPNETGGLGIIFVKRKGHRSTHTLCSASIVTNDENIFLFNRSFNFQPLEHHYLFLSFQIIYLKYVLKIFLMPNFVCFGRVEFKLFSFIMFICS